MSALNQLQAITNPATQSNDPRQLAIPLTVKDLVLITDALAEIKVYAALLTQGGIGLAPTAVVQKNTTGNDFTFAYVATGNYTIYHPTAFNDMSKVNITTASGYNSGLFPSTASVVFDVLNVSGGFVPILTIDSTDAPVDTMLNSTSIRIEIYP